MKKLITLLLITLNLALADAISEAKAAIEIGDFETAISKLSKECNKKTKNLAACHNLGLVYLNGEGKASNLGEALRLFKLACGSKTYQSCQSLGLMYENGIGVTKDLFIAFDYYKKSCDKSFWQGCANLAYMYENGLGTRQDLKKARDLYEKACENKEYSSCVNLGLIYQNAKGVKRDLKKAKEFFKIACDAKNSASCHNLSIIYLSENNQTALLDSLAKSCEYGMVENCLELGTAYTNGTNTEQNLTKAKEFFGKACDLRNSKGCDSYKVLNEAGF